MAALATLDVSPTVVGKLRVTAAIITIYNCSLVELPDARTQLCYPVHETCSWTSPNFHFQVSSTSMTQPPAELLRQGVVAAQGICPAWVLLKQALLTFGCTSSGGGRG